MNKYKNIDITGKKYNKLTAVRFSNTGNDGHHLWLFKCDCGKERIIRKGHVVHGNTKSCGCIRSNNINGKKHGMYKTRFYRVWRNMKTRCFNKKHEAYKNYGGRGIIVCDRWLKFENFRDDMYKNYLKHINKYGEKQTTIDRINNDKNYYLENCEWSTYKKQANNRRNNHILIFNKQALSMKQWAEKTGINKSTLRERINRWNWSVEEALTIPINNHKNHV